MRVRGVAGINRMLRELERKGSFTVGEVIKGTAQQIATDAKDAIQASPNNYEKIAQSIGAEKETQLKWNIHVNELPMGAYVEFGTGTFVEVPQGWEETAMAFYVNGQGWLEPEPYLIPAYNKGKQELDANLRDAFSQLVAQFNR